MRFWREAVSVLMLHAMRRNGPPGARALPLLLLVAGTLRAEPAFFTARVLPILDKHCVVCHGPEKQKAGLRLDSFEHTMKGGEGGEVVKPRAVKESELFRRITLPHDDEEVMPSDGKPLLAPEEIKVIELWIAAGASATEPVSAFPHAPALKPRKAEVVALAPDWRPRAKQIVALEKELGLKLVPRSQVATDGLILRTASAPTKCDDATLAKLAPVAELIVEAELGRTKVTDKGLATVGGWRNLRALDLTRTQVTSEGVGALSGLAKLEALNLTSTGVDDAGVEKLKTLPALKRVWVFGTKVSHPNADGRVAGTP